MIHEWLVFRIPLFAGSDWIPFIFSLVVFAYGGIPFIKMTMPEIHNREPGMMTLISLAISVAVVYSLAAQLFNFSKSRKLKKYPKTGVRASLSNSVIY